MLVCHSASFATDALAADPPAAMRHSPTQQDSTDLKTINNEIGEIPIDYAPSTSQRSLVDLGDMDSTEEDSGGGALRMTVSLLVVLALIAAGVFLLKKIAPYSGLIGSQAHAKHPTVLSRLSLGQRSSICLIRIADEILVVGITNTNMSLLSKISADDYYSEDANTRGTPANVSAQTSIYGGNFRSFRKVLEKIGVCNRKTSDAP